MWVIIIYFVIIRHDMFQTGFLDSNFNWAVINKLSKVYEIVPNVTNSQKIVTF